MRIKALFLAGFGFLFFGCASAPKPVVNEALTIDEIRQHLVQSSGSLKNFSAEGTITVNTPTMNQSAGFEMSARGSDSVKMSVYGPFGITVGNALITPNEFTAYNALNNTVYRGSPERQMKMLPFVNNIPFELLMGSLQGVHLIHFSHTDSFTVTTGRGYSFTCTYDDRSFDKFLVDGNLFRVTRCTRRDNNGNAQWSISYSFKQTEEGTIVPEQVVLHIPSKETTLLIDYGSVLYDSLSTPFTISYPEDAEIIIIE